MIATWYVNTEGTIRIHPLKLLKGELRIVTIDWNAYLGSKGTSGSQIDFTSTDGAISIADAVLTGGVSTVEITAVDEGAATVKSALTCANGEILVRTWFVTVVDPSVTSGVDYSS